MKTQILNQVQPANLPVDRAALILHEQLALKRLKELPLLAKPHIETPKPKRGLPVKWALGILGDFWIVLFKRAELTRQVAPDQPPIHWHEIERARDLRALNLL